MYIYILEKCIYTFSSVAEPLCDSIKLTFLGIYAALFTIDFSYKVTVAEAVHVSRLTYLGTSYFL